MVSAIPFAGMTAILALEGWLLLSAIGFTKSWLKFFLSLPISTIPNTIVILALTIVNLPLAPAYIISLHLIIGLILTIFILLKRPNQYACKSTCKLVNLQTSQLAGRHSIAILACSLILLITLTYSFTHSVLLPTFHYDSAMNWNMRSKVSFIEKKLVLSDHHKLIAKPHYPFLYHALQITTQQGQNEWNDRYANLIHFLMSLSSITALFLMIKKLKGVLHAITAVTVITTTPLFAMHLGGSYADVPLALFALLSLACFFIFKDTAEFKWIILSAVFVSAGVWTKSEGLPFALLPWFLIVALLWKNHPGLRSKINFGALTAIILSGIWPLTAFIYGLSLSPHGTKDTAISLQNGAIPEAMKVIFSGGSFGPALPIAIAMSLIIMIKTRRILYFIWGFLALFGIIFVYTFTSNATYLLNGQSFDRQMILPFSILILSLACSFNTEKTKNP